MMQIFSQRLAPSHGQTGNVEQSDIDRKKQLADVLKMMSMQQNPQYQAGGNAIIAGLAPIMQALAAKKTMASAKTDQETLLGQQDRDYQRVLQAYQGTPGTGGSGDYSEPPTDSAPGGREAMVQAMLGAQIPALRKTGLETITMAGKNMPSTVQEWNFYNSLPESEKAKFLEMKRNPNILNLGDMMAVRGPGGGISESYRVNLKPGEQPSVRGEQSAAAEAGKTKAESETKAKIDLPGVIAGTEQTINLIDDLVKHPGMSDVVGVPGLTGIPAKMGAPVPGTNAAGFMSRLEQLKGKQFLEAFQSLKGGGQITEVEGRKATDAMSRLGQLGQTEEEYKAAAQELKDVMTKGLERARLKAGQSSTSPTSPTSIDDLLKKY